eukprot:15433427-Alexandrium_andersonii.AAC.1
MGAGAVCKSASRTHTGARLGPGEGAAPGPRRSSRLAQHARENHRAQAGPCPPPPEQTDAI